MSELTADHPVSVVATDRHVVVSVDGRVVADSSHPLRLFEVGHEPVWYLPPDDVVAELLEPTDRRTHCPRKGDASYWCIRVDGREIPDAVWSYLDPLAPAADIAGHYAFYSDKVEITAD
jgi:uncharacterized protein (DUF427 family)